MIEKYVKDVAEIISEYLPPGSEIYLRGSSLHSENPLDIDILVVLPDKFKSDKLRAIKQIENDGGRRLTRVIGYELIDNGALDEYSKEHGVQIVYSKEVIGGMKKYETPPIEITILRRKDLGMKLRKGEKILLKKV